MFIDVRAPRIGVKARDMTRKWRRKPLKSLKTDSEIAIRSPAVLQQTAPWQPLSSAPRYSLTTEVYGVREASGNNASLGDLAAKIG